MFAATLADAKVQTPYGTLVGSTVKVDKKEVQRIEFQVALELQPIANIIVAVLCAQKGEQKYGKQPKGNLERQINKYLTKMGVYKRE